MSDQRADLNTMLRMRQYLQEAQDLATEAEIPSPAPGENTDFETPSSVLALVDASAERADIVIRRIEEKLKTAPDN